MRGVRVSGHDVIQFTRALGIARNGQHHRVRVGALLAKGRRVKGRASNVALPDATEPHFPGHAERRVIAGQPAIKGTLYVARIGLNGEPLASFPCDECMVHIVACACVSKIVYHDGKALRKVRL